MGYLVIHQAEMVPHILNTKSQMSSNTLQLTHIKKKMKAINVRPINIHMRRNIKISYGLVD